MPPEYWLSVLEEAATDGRPVGPSVRILHCTKFSDMFCGSHVAAVDEWSRSRRPTRSGWPVRKPSGRTSNDWKFNRALAHVRMDVLQAGFVGFGALYTLAPRGSGG